MKASKSAFNRVRSMIELFDLLPENERIITDVLCQIIRANLPSDCKEKLTYNVPFFYGNRGICIIWPAAIPRGGIKEGVLLGFWHGNKLLDPEHYLTKGTNKRVFYRIFKQVDEIEEAPISRLLKEAVRIDKLTNS